jgi:hypothetical protein
MADVPHIALSTSVSARWARRVTMANETSEIVLSMQDLREVTGYAAESAQEVLEIFERAHPDELPRSGSRRPRRHEATRE